MRTLVNDPGEVVREMLEGFADVVCPAHRDAA